MKKLIEIVSQVLTKEGYRNMSNLYGAERVAAAYAVGLTRNLDYVTIEDGVDHFKNTGIEFDAEQALTIAILEKNRDVFEY